MRLVKLPSLLSTKYVRNLLRADNLQKFDEHYRLIEANPGDQFHENYKKFVNNLKNFKINLFSFLIFVVVVFKCSYTSSCLLKYYAMYPTQSNLPTPVA